MILCITSMINVYTKNVPVMERDLISHTTNICVALLSQVWYNRTYQVKILLDKDVEGGYNYIYM